MNGMLGLNYGFPIFAKTARRAARNSLKLETNRATKILSWLSALRCGPLLAFSLGEWMLKIDHLKDAAWIRILNGISLICACTALFLVIADLGEPIHPTRLWAELAIIVAAAGMFVWARGK